MKRSTRILTLVAVFGIGLVLYASAMFAMAVAYDGMIRVYVEDRAEGVTVRFPMPGVVMEAGAAVAPWFIPDEEMAEIRAEVGAWGPMVMAIAEELEAMPDATLVDVHDGEEHVRIVKQGSNFLVLVDADDAHVEVTVPARAMRRSLSHLLG